MVLVDRPALVVAPFGVCIPLGIQEPICLSFLAEPPTLSIWRCQALLPPPGRSTRPEIEQWLCPADLTLGRTPTG